MAQTSIAQPTFLAWRMYVDQGATLSRKCTHLPVLKTKENTLKKMRGSADTPCDDDGYDVATSTRRIPAVSLSPYGPSCICFRSLLGSPRPQWKNGLLQDTALAPRYRSLPRDRCRIGAYESSGFSAPISHLSITGSWSSVSLLRSIMKKVPFEGHSVWAVQ